MADLTPKEKARDKRYRKNYDWSLERVNKLAEVQNHRCGICGREAKNMPLNVDHFHFKVSAMCVGKNNWFEGHQGGWIATSDLKHPVLGYVWAKTKQEALDIAYKKALPHSVRGLLCPGRHRGCNRLLGRVDSLTWLKAAIKYLENPPALRVAVDQQKIPIKA